ncbi:MAG TPA: CHAD domain-containing protein [Bacteroidota bacterium]|nr:CHAD domain-containing protein [Bacteroidota bacterium]
MAKRAVIKPNKSLRDNARILVPHLLEEFLSHRARVVAHPRLKKDFHSMRVAGKTLRYAMEVFEAAFGGEFAACLEEVKELLDAMGRVHDCDVCIPTLQTHLREIRSFNRVTGNAGDRMRTKAVTDLIRAQHAQRDGEYARSCATIEEWTAKDFAQRVILSMTAS